MNLSAYWSMWPSSLTLTSLSLSHAWAWYLAQEYLSGSFICLGNQNHSHSHLPVTEWAYLPLCYWLPLMLLTDVMLVIVYLYSIITTSELTNVLYHKVKSKKKHEKANRKRCTAQHFKAKLCCTARSDRQPSAVHKHQKNNAIYLKQSSGRRPNQTNGFFSRVFIHSIYLWFCITDISWQIVPESLHCNSKHLNTSTLKRDLGCTGSICSTDISAFLWLCCYYLPTKPKPVILSYTKCMIEFRNILKLTNLI